MKFSIATVLVTLTMGSAAMGAIVAPEPATPVEKRQLPTDPAAISGLLANPSAALAQATSLLANPQISSAFRELVTASSFEAQISSAYVQQLGSQTGQAALQSYNAVISSLLGGSAAKPSSTSGASGSKSTSAGSANTSSAGGSSSGSSTSGNNGASGVMVISAMGSAIVAGAAVVMAAL